MLRKTLVLAFLVAVFSTTANGDLLGDVGSVLNTVASSVLDNEYGDAVKRLIYSFTNNDEDNGSTREERGYLVKYPGSDKEELLVMGSYGTVDKDGTELITMYKADRNGYRPMFKIRKFSPNALKTIAG